MDNLFEYKVRPYRERKIAIRRLKPRNDFFITKAVGKLNNAILKKVEDKQERKIANSTGDAKFAHDLRTKLDEQKVSNPDLKRALKQVDQIGGAAVTTAAILGAGVAAGIGAGGAGTAGAATGTGTATGTGAAGAATGTVTGTGVVGTGGAIASQLKKGDPQSVVNDPVEPTKPSDLKIFGKELGKQVLTPQVAAQIGNKVASGLLDRNRIGSRDLLNRMVDGNETVPPNNDRNVLGMFGTGNNTMIIFAVVLLVLLMLSKKRK